MPNLDQFANEVLAWSGAMHRPKTVKANSLALRKLAALAGSGCDLTALGPRHADMVMAQDRQKGNKANSINNFLRHLKSVFNKAVEWGYLERNPFEKMKMARKSRSRPLFMTKEQISQFLETIEDNETRLLATAYLATGRRRAELLQLKWEDIDLEKRVYKMHSTKVDLSTEYPINLVFLSALMQIPRRGPYVFQRWRHADTITHLLKKHLVKAGFGHLRVHSLRHSFASVYLMSGGDLRSLMELLGHSQISTTMIYSHLTQKHLQSEVDKVTFL